jgi:hypothetical protein
LIIDITLSVILAIILQDFEHVDFCFGSIDDVNVLLPDVQELEHVLEALLHDLKAEAGLALHTGALVVEELRVLELQSGEAVLGLLRFFGDGVEDKLSVP